MDIENNFDEKTSDGRTILKKQNSDDSGLGEPIDDNNSITRPTDHPPNKVDPFEGEFLEKLQYLSRKYWFLKPLLRIRVMLIK